MNRPKIAPKPKFVQSLNDDDRRFPQQQQQKPQIRSQTSKDEIDSDYDKPRKDIDDVAEVNWRLGRLGSFTLFLD
ncbi:unnamed protein product [Anisakis simplex]|uniref:Uncharacterized protein n=1 Tax=Anisakis simplex TaxID=6269 RepID=A0A0M3J9B5_ANISI|nr:unnamed protein product [Anisakis simplex]